MTKFAKQYEKHSRPWDAITSSRCAGVCGLNQEYLIFAKFARIGPEELAVDRVPLHEIERASRWGEAMCRLASKIAQIFPTPPLANSEAPQVIAAT